LGLDDLGPVLESDTGDDLGPNEASSSVGRSRVTACFGRAGRADRPRRLADQESDADPSSRPPGAASSTAA